MAPEPIRIGDLANRFVEQSARDTYDMAHAAKALNMRHSMEQLLHGADLMIHTENEGNSPPQVQLISLMDDVNEQAHMGHSWGYWLSRQHGLDGVQVTDFQRFEREVLLECIQQVGRNIHISRAKLAQIILHAEKCRKETDVEHPQVQTLPLNMGFHVLANAVQRFAIAEGYMKDRYIMSTDSGESNVFNEIIQQRLQMQWMTKIVPSVAVNVGKKIGLLVKRPDQA